MSFAQILSHPCTPYCNRGDVLSIEQSTPVGSVHTRRKRQTGCVVELSNSTRQRKMMSLLLVDEVGGTGRRLSKKLETMGITAMDMADSDIHFVRKHFSMVFERTVRELRGEHHYCRFISAFAKTSTFAPNEPYCGNSVSVKLLTLTPGPPRHQQHQIHADRPRFYTGSAPCPHLCR